MSFQVMWKQKNHQTLCYRCDQDFLYSIFDSKISPMTLKSLEKEENRYDFNCSWIISHNSVLLIKSSSLYVLSFTGEKIILVAPRVMDTTKHNHVRTRGTVEQNSDLMGNQESGNAMDNKPNARSNAISKLVRLRLKRKAENQDSMGFARKRRPYNIPVPPTPPARVSFNVTFSPPLPICKSWPLIFQILQFFP